MSIRIKICCMTSVDEAAAAVRCGASAVGLVSEMPSGPGVVAEPLIREIAAAVPSTVESFLLTSRVDAAGIAAQYGRCGTTTIQLVDRLPASAHAELRVALPGVRLVQVVHVVDESSVTEAVAVAPLVDAILLDSGSPDAAVKELGGTGRTHNWELSSRIVESVPVPVYLAGGLNPDNVAEAVRRVRPHGVDVCSGVRTEGLLDENKVAAFIVRAREG